MLDAEMAACGMLRQAHPTRWVSRLDEWGRPATVKVFYG
jgi:hypothetical protein